MPSLKTDLWRGVAETIGSNLMKNDIQIWWSVNSCTTDLKVVEYYLGEKNTLFAIKSYSGKDISSFSAFTSESEVVLMPGTRFCIKSDTLNYKNTLFLVQLEEIHQSIQQNSG